MKKVLNIKCISKTKNEQYEYFKIYIYEKGRLIFSGNADKYGCLSVKLCAFRYYDIVCLNLNNPKIEKIKIRIFFFSYCLQNLFLFFGRNKENSIKILVTDKFYPDLPIEKGNINLWQTIM